jgi:hypothetical protein
VNTSLYFVPGILARGPMASVRQRGPVILTPQVLILAEVTVSLLLLGGDTERDTYGGTPRRMVNANSVDNLRMSSPDGSSIDPSVSSSYGIDMIALTMIFRKEPKIKDHLTTEWEIVLWCNVGLMLVILGAAELKREVMRTVERVSADDVLSCRISPVTYYHRLRVSISNRPLTGNSRKPSIAEDSASFRIKRSKE